MVSSVLPFQWQRSISCLQKPLVMPQNVWLFWWHIMPVSWAVFEMYETGFGQNICKFKHSGSSLTPTESPARQFLHKLVDVRRTLVSTADYRTPPSECGFIGLAGWMWAGRPQRSSRSRGWKLDEWRSLVSNFKPFLPSHCFLTAVVTLTCHNTFFILRKAMFLNVTGVQSHPPILAPKKARVPSLTTPVHRWLDI